jgi:hypothetical protein
LSVNYYSLTQKTQKFMRKRFLLFGITLAAMATSCYGPNDSVYTEDLDVVYTQKKDGFDFTTKTNCYVSDTVIFIDSDGDAFKVPNERQEGHPDLSKGEAAAMVANIKNEMTALGWNIIEATDLESPLPYPDSINVGNTVVMNSVISKTTYVGGGYYPWYPDWGWGYPGYPGGWYPWYPTYYTYTTGSVSVTMYQINPNPGNGDGVYGVIWENYLSGYVRNGIEISHINKGINQGFRQSKEYLNISKK